jgi:hypothetical protein
MGVTALPWLHKQARSCRPSVEFATGLSFDGITAAAAFLTILTCTFSKRFMRRNSTEIFLIKRGFRRVK